MMVGNPYHKQDLFHRLPSMIAGDRTLPLHGNEGITQKRGNYEHRSHGDGFRRGDDITQSVIINCTPSVLAFPNGFCGR